MQLREIVPVWRLERFRHQLEQRKYRLFTRKMLRYNRAAASKLGVEAACHTEDFIYQFCIKHTCFSAVGSSFDYYFGDGHRSALKFGNIVSELGIEKRPIKLLEFASGYGCVTRHLKKNTDLS